MTMLRVVGGMLSTRYFCRWMLPTIAGIICGYGIGAFLLAPTLLQCPSHTRRTNTHPNKPQPKVEVYRWENLKQPINQREKVQKFVYVAMMSAERYLPTRAHAAIDTWARDVAALRADNETVKVEVFATGADSINGVNVRQLPGVADNVYPPQRKSFSMLRYLHDHHLNEYDWFVRLDDDAYLSWPILEKLLRRLDPSLPLYIGSPGFGKDDEDYVEEDMTYCMGGPGIIMSRELLRQLSPHLPSCLKKLMTEHEDLELGRCIQEKLGISCIRAYEANRLFKQNYDYNKQSAKERQKMFNDIATGAVATYHPNKDPTHQYELYQALKAEEIDKLIKSTHAFEKQITFDDERNCYTNKPEVPALHHLPVSRDRVDNWRQFTGGRFFNIQQKVHKIAPVWVEAISVGARETAKLIYRTMKLNGRITKITVPEVYSQTSKRGAELVGTIVIRHTTTETSGKPTNQNINSRIRISRSFLSRPFLREAEPIDMTTISHCVSSSLSCRSSTVDRIPVKIIVPLTGRPDVLTAFVGRFEALVLEHQEPLHLVVVNFPDNADIADNRLLKDELVELGNKLAGVQVILTEESGDFSRGKALQVGAQKAQDDELLFFCDVDVVFDRTMLRRIRYNTIKGSTVYYPVVFSRFDPSATTKQSVYSLDINEGFWREYGFGMVGIYKLDFNKSGGFDMSLQGWGLEDVHLVANLVLREKKIMRANDPTLIHPWHDKVCSLTLPPTQLTPCLRTRASHLGSTPWLFPLFKKRHADD